MYGVLWYGGGIKKFHPLALVSNEWVDWFVERQGIRLSELYYEPFNFKRTGCIGCPFNPKIKNELQMLLKHDTVQFHVAVSLWRPVYEEYKRLGYRHMDELDID